jgi:hypothetical protein
MTTPEDIKRKYQDMLNNEIMLSDPIGWMKPDSEFIIMTACSHSLTGSGYAGRHGKVAICEVKAGVKPKMISERAKGMVRIIELHDHLYKGGPKSGYATTLEDAKRKCAELNARAARLSEMTRDA